MNIGEIKDVLFDRIVVKCDEVEEKTHHGIVIKDEKEQPMTGTVIACGPGGGSVTHGEMPLKIGDRVLF